MGAERRRISDGVSGEQEFPEGGQGGGAVQLPEPAVFELKGDEGAQACAEVPERADPGPVEPESLQRRQQPPDRVALPEPRPPGTYHAPAVAAAAAGARVVVLNGVDHEVNVSHCSEVAPPSQPPKLVLECSGCDIKEIDARAHGERARVVEEAPRATAPF